MMVKPDDILQQVQSFLTLEEGDVVMTGTPKGVGVIQSNDRFIGQVFLCDQASYSSHTKLLSCEWRAQ